MHLFAVRLLAVLALLCLRACYAHAFICRSFACSASTAVLEGLLSPKATSCKELALHLHRLSGVLCPPSALHRCQEVPFCSTDPSADASTAKLNCMLHKSSTRLNMNWQRVAYWSREPL